MTVTATQSAERRGAGVAVGLVCAAQFVLQLDFSIVNVALPAMQRNLWLLASQLQWIVTGHALTWVQGYTANSQA